MLAVTLWHFCSMTPWWILMKHESCSCPGRLPWTLVWVAAWLNCWLIIVHMSQLVKVGFLCRCQSWFIGLLGWIQISVCVYCVSSDLSVSLLSKEGGCFSLSSLISSLSPRHPLLSVCTFGSEMHKSDGHSERDSEAASWLTFSKKLEKPWHKHCFGSAACCGCMLAFIQANLSFSSRRVDLGVEIKPPERDGMIVVCAYEVCTSCTCVVWP